MMMGSRHSMRSSVMTKVKMKRTTKIRIKKMERRQTERTESNGTF